ncbi:MAG: mechanosensitive ion channel [Campylobacterota bacterium]|nr:mechanosensitive ion channel [Campylobacterota bacterium]
MDMGHIVTQYAIQFALAVAIFIIGKKIAIYAKNWIKKGFSKSGMDATLSNFLCDVAYGLMLIFVVLAALGQVGVETTSFIAILGAAGLAIGLAFQGALSNIGAGVMIIFFRPFKIGDFVEAGGTTGVVEDINVFNTVLKTGDNKVIIVGNSNIISGNITNYSAKDTRRVDLTFGIGYDDDLKLAKQTLIDIINADERVLKDPEPFVAVSELADSSVNFVVRAWVKSGDYWGVYFDTLETVKTTFDDKGISIPYPQMDVHQHTA